MPDPDAARRTLMPAAALSALNGVMMLLAPHVDHAPLTGPVFEILRWGCLLSVTLLLATVLAAISQKGLKGDAVKALWPMSLSGVLPTLALYLVGYLARA